VRQHFYRSLSGESVAVIGFGDIGSAAARARQGHLAHVIVYDVDPVRQASAWSQGFRVGSLMEAISTSNLILGCSGSRSLTRDVLGHAPDGAVFASGSSKQVEIDVDFFIEAALPIDAEGGLLVREHAGRRLFQLNEGQPINFVDGSAIGSTLDLVHRALRVYRCAGARLDQQPRAIGSFHARAPRNRSDLAGPVRTAASSESAR
jgi:S-adenosylhomocysteine hydrolase